MSRPNVTQAQIIGLITAGVPIVANLLHVFGVYSLTLEQQHALNDTIVWAAGFSAVLVAADAHLRAARNKADAIRPPHPDPAGSFPVTAAQTWGAPPAKPRSRARKPAPKT